MKVGVWLLMTGMVVVSACNKEAAEDPRAAEARAFVAETSAEL